MSALCWDELWTENRWGECVATDVAGIVSGIVSYLERRGFDRGVPNQQIARTIIEWIWRRQTRRANQMRGPRTRAAWPAGWTAQHEDTWCEWIEIRLTPESFEAEVLMPVFGTDTRTWETVCGGWREELFYFLPSWVERSFDRLEEISPGSAPPDDSRSATGADDDAGSADW
jgi:hypothetical protein